MSHIELLLLAVGLCFDTFAVSLCGGITIGRKLSRAEVLKIIFCFAVFQAGFAALGWALGLTVSEYIERFDHWIAFVLLGYIGGKMAYEGFTSKDEAKDELANEAKNEAKGEVADNVAAKCGCGKERTSLLNPRQRVLLSIATSIDAIAVGISIACLQLPYIKIGICLSEVFACTALASLIGLLGGRKLGTKIGARSEILGGLILIAIGIKIVIEHIF